MMMFRGNIKFIVLSLLFLMFFLSVLIMAFSVSRQTDELISELNKKVDYLAARIALNTADYMNLNEVVDVNNKMKVIVEEISETDIYDFYEIYFQPIHIVNYTGPEIFMYGYEQGNTSTVSIENSVGETVVVSAINSIQLSENCFSTFGITVVEGRDFTESEYKYNTGNTIPVLLGSEFYGYFSIGDRFSVEYLTESFQFEVVGIIEAEAYIPVGSSLTYLNRYMVIPMFDIADTAEFLSPDFERIYLGNKITGYVNYNDGYTESDVKDFLNGISDKNDFPRYIIMNTPSAMSIGGLPVDASVAGFLVDFAYGFSTLLLLTYTLLSYKTLSNRRGRVAAMLISGERASNISLRWMIESVIQVIVALVLALLIAQFILKDMRIDYRVVFIAAVIILVQIVLERIVYCRNNLSKALVEEAKNVD